MRRLACDADIIPVALGTRGEVLDVGRAHRFVTPALWQALVCRDKHCAFPGCTKPPVMGHAHHIVHWADRGPTKLDNLVLLCGHHHRVIHHTPWQVRINPDDGRPEFLPPPKPGQHHPPPQWIQATPPPAHPWRMMPCGPRPRCSARDGTVSGRSASMALNEYEPGCGIPRRDRPDRRTSRRPAWPRPARPVPGTPNVLIDRPRRHRLRPARLLRQPDRDAELRRARGGRAALQQHAHDGAVLAEPVVHPHRPQPPQQRHGLHHRARHGLPRLQRRHPVRERLPLGDAARARLQHLHGRQVAPDAQQPGDGRRPVRPLAAGARASSASTASSAATRASGIPTSSTTTTRSSRPATPGGGLPPHRGPGRQVDRVHRRRQAGRPRQAVLPAPRASAPRTRRTTSPRSGRTSTRGSSTTAGTPTGRRSSRGRRSWGSCPPTPSCPGTTRTCPTGTPSPSRRPPAVQPDDGGLRRLPQPHRPPPRAGCSTSCASRDSSTTRSSW